MATESSSLNNLVIVSINDRIKHVFDVFFLCKFFNTAVYGVATMDGLSILVLEWNV